MGRPDYRDALTRMDVLARLAAFDPHVAGTPPLGLALAGSDIDVLCHAPDPDCFASAVWQAFGGCQGFAMWQWQGGDRPVIARFEGAGWIFELFGQARPVAAQLGWRHFVVERRLLSIGGAPFARTVRALREDGLKTEPAFAAALGLAGDPYQAVLALERLDDRALARIVARAG
ncbi:DUF4269 domain-containing protein [Sphingomonas sp. ac-8]|uniref:DUF4269 domain-containing protein n=1 Tax=Sphingomonas sp. ac-8 TaxID=3242977 RepID=UPI003A7F768C